VRATNGDSSSGGAAGSRGAADATTAAITSALGAVEEPELARSIVELGMVKGVAVDGRTCVVAVALPLPSDATAGELTRRVTVAAGSVEGVDRVDVDLREMTDAELQGVAAVLKGQPAPNPLQVRDASASAPAAPRVNPFTDSRTRVLAVASGKGGVGKSSVTTNVAVALAQRGKRVAAVDADVWGFSMPRMLGIAHPPGLIDDVIVPPQAHGVKLISMGFFAREDQAIIWRGPMLHKALEQFLTDVYWGELDYLLVDMPPGTGDVSLSMSQFIPRAELIVVTTPQPAAQRVAQRAAAMAEKVDLDVIGVVENMSWFTGDDGRRYELFGSGGGLELAEHLGVPLLGQVPLVPALRVGGDEGAPIVAVHPDDEASVAFRAIAERLDTELAPKRVYHPELRLH
jgi:ATP-binding protein involved in chromosome partitioning